MSSAVANNSVGRMLKRVNKTRAPEDSIPLRAAVLAAVMTGAVALVVQQAVPLTSAALALVGLPVAYTVSYLRRHSDNYAIKIGDHDRRVLRTCSVLADRSRAISDTGRGPFPTGGLVPWVQVLHGFDLPARKDLNFSLGSSLALMAVAGSLSQDMRFGVMLLIYFFFVTFALVLAHRSELAEGTTASMRVPNEGTKRRNVLWDAGRAVIAAGLAGARSCSCSSRSRLRCSDFSIPFSLGSGVGIPSDGGIANPGFESGDLRSLERACLLRLRRPARPPSARRTLRRSRDASPLHVPRRCGAAWSSMSTTAWHGGRRRVEVENWVSSDPFHYPIEYPKPRPSGDGAADLLHRGRAAERDLRRRATRDRVERWWSRDRRARRGPDAVDAFGRNRLQRRVDARLRVTRDVASASTRSAARTDRTIPAAPGDPARARPRPRATKSRPAQPTTTTGSRRSRHTSPTTTSTRSIHRYRRKAATRSITSCSTPRSASASSSPLRPR